MFHRASQLSNLVKNALHTKIKSPWKSGTLVQSALLVGISQKDELLAIVGIARLHARGRRWRRAAVPSGGQRQFLAGINLGEHGPQFFRDVRGHVAARVAIDHPQHEDPVRQQEVPQENSFAVYVAPLAARWDDFRLKQQLLHEPGGRADGKRTRKPQGDAEEHEETGGHVPEPQDHEHHFVQHVDGQHALRVHVVHADPVANRHSAESDARKDAALVPVDTPEDIGQNFNAEEAVFLPELEHVMHEEQHADVRRKEDQLAAEVPGAQGGGLQAVDKPPQGNLPPVGKSAAHSAPVPALFASRRDHLANEDGHVARRGFPVLPVLLASSFREIQKALKIDVGSEAVRHAPHEEDEERDETEAVHDERHPRIKV